MAFGGILIFNLILTTILGAAVLGVACLIAALILIVIHITRKRTGKPIKKWIPVLSIILTIACLLANLPLLFLLVLSS